MAFTIRNLKQDLEDVGPRFDGASDLEFGMATKALELGQSGLSYQRAPRRRIPVNGPFIGKKAQVVSEVGRDNESSSPRSARNMAMHGGILRP